MIGMNAKKLVLIILLLFFFLTAIGVMGFPQEKQDEGRKRQLSWALDGIKARIELVKVQPEILDFWASGG